MHTIIFTLYYLNNIATIHCTDFVLRSTLVYVIYYLSTPIHCTDFVLRSTLVYVIWPINPHPLHWFCTQEHLSLYFTAYQTIKVSLRARSRSESINGMRWVYELHCLQWGEFSERCMNCTVYNGVNLRGMDVVVRVWSYWTFNIYYNVTWGVWLWWMWCF